MSKQCTFSNTQVSCTSTDQSGGSWQTALYGWSSWWTDWCERGWWMEEPGKDGSGTERSGCSAGTSSRCRCWPALQRRCDWWRTEKEHSVSSQTADETDWFENTSRCSLPKHGDEQVDEQDVGDQQINNQQDYHQPVTVQNSTRLFTAVNQRDVVRALHVPLLPHWDRHKNTGKIKTCPDCNGCKRYIILTLLFQKLLFCQNAQCTDFVPSISSTGICPKMCR